MINKILVVSDDVAMSDFLRSTLRTGGFEVALAANGDSAQQILAVYAADLIIADASLAEPDGVSSILHVRQAGVTAPVLAILRHAPDRASLGFHHQKAVPARQFLTWPFSALELLSTVWDLETHHGAASRQSAKRPLVVTFAPAA